MKEVVVATSFFVEIPTECLFHKNSLRSKDAQLAVMKLLLCSPLARGDFASRNLFLNEKERNESCIW